MFINKFLKIIIFTCLIICMSSFSWAGSSSFVVLKNWGKAVYVKRGLVSNEVFALDYSYNRWRIWNLKSSGILDTPYECPYSEERNLRLEAGGRAYFVSKKNKRDRVEVRIIREDWMYDPDGAGNWVLLLDFY